MTAPMTKEKKNTNFVQIYRNNMPELRWLMSKSGIASSMLFFILEHMDYRNTLVCSNSVLTEYFDVSRTTIYRAQKLLQDNGFLDVLKTGTSNIYIVNQEVAWTAYEDQKEFAEFDGKMLVSKKENADYYHSTRYDKLKALRKRENLK